MNRRTGILQDKIAAFKLQRDIEVEEAAAHIQVSPVVHPILAPFGVSRNWRVMKLTIQEASDSTRFAKAIRHSLNWQ